MSIGDYRVKLLEEEAAKTDRTKHIHVTDLSRCLGGVWQEKTGRGKSDINASKLRRFDAGHNIEARVIEALKHAEVLVDTQTKVAWPEYNMVGSADAIIKEDGEYWLVEVKSIHPFGISHLYKSNKVHEHYREQINLYLNGLQEEYPGMKARIYYEALDGRTYEEVIAYDPNIVQDAMTRARALHEAIAADKIPKLPETYIQQDGKWKLNWRIQYCLSAGLHQKCDPEMAKLHPDPEKIISKLTYQAGKRNK